MNSYVPYDTLRAYKINHKLILGLAESLSDDQLLWKPAGYNNSIGFNLWHIARWSDNLIAQILKECPELGIELGDATEIWEQESLGEKWGLPAVLYPGGTGLSDEAADGLSFPTKEEMLTYLRKTFLRTEEFVEKFDTGYPSSQCIVDEKLHKKLSAIRWNLYYYLMHHCRHLGMMEALKGANRQRLCGCIMLALVRKFDCSPVFGKSSCNLPIHFVNSSLFCIMLPRQKIGCHCDIRFKFIFLVSPVLPR